MSEEILSEQELQAYLLNVRWCDREQAEKAALRISESHRALAKERDAFKVDLRAAQAGIVPAHCMLIRKEEYDALKRQVEELKKGNSHAE